MLTHLDENSGSATEILWSCGGTKKHNIADHTFILSSRKQIILWCRTKLLQVHKVLFICYYFRYCSLWFSYMSMIEGFLEISMSNESDRYLIFRTYDFLHLKPSFQQCESAHLQYHHREEGCWEFKCTICLYLIIEPYNPKYKPVSYSANKFLSEMLRQGKCSS